MSCTNRDEAKVAEHWRGERKSKSSLSGTVRNGWQRQEASGGKLTQPKGHILRAGTCRQPKGESYCQTRPVFDEVGDKITKS